MARYPVVRFQVKHRGRHCNTGAAWFNADPDATVSVWTAARVERLIGPTPDSLEVAPGSEGTAQQLLGIRMPCPFREEATCRGILDDSATVEHENPGGERADGA